MLMLEKLYERPVRGCDEIARSVTALIAVALRHPESWQKIRHLKPEWFSDWGDQILWQALVYTLNENDGLGEYAVFETWLRDNYPDEADGLLERLSQHNCEYLWRDFVEHDVRIIERHGLRKSLTIKLETALNLLRERAALAEVRRVVADAYHCLGCDGGAV